MQKFSSESRTLALVHYNLCTFSPMSYELFCDFSSNHMCRSWALDFLVRLFVLIACVAHGFSNGMCQPWALNFLVGFMFYITFVTHGLWHISREFSSNRMCRPWVMGFWCDFSSYCMCRPFATNFLCDFSPYPMSSPWALHFFVRQ